MKNAVLRLLRIEFNCLIFNQGQSFDASIPYRCRSRFGGVQRYVTFRRCTVSCCVWVVYSATVRLGGVQRYVAFGRCTAPHHVQAVSSAMLCLGGVQRHGAFRRCTAPHNVWAVYRSPSRPVAVQLHVVSINIGPATIQRSNLTESCVPPKRDVARYSA